MKVARRYDPPKTTSGKTPRFLIGELRHLIRESRSGGEKCISGNRRMSAMVLLAYLEGLIETPYIVAPKEKPVGSRPDSSHPDLTPTPEAPIDVEALVEQLGK